MAPLRQQSGANGADSLSHKLEQYLWLAKNHLELGIWVGWFQNKFQHKVRQAGAELGQAQLKL